MSVSACLSSTLPLLCAWSLVLPTYALPHQCRFTPPFSLGILDEGFKVEPVCNCISDTHPFATVNPIWPRSIRLVLTHPLSATEWLCFAPSSLCRRLAFSTRHVWPMHIRDTPQTSPIRVTRCTADLVYDNSIARIPESDLSSPDLWAHPSFPVNFSRPVFSHPLLSVGVATALITLLVFSAPPPLAPLGLHLRHAKLVSCDAEGLGGSSPSHLPLIFSILH